MYKDNELQFSQAIVIPQGRKKTMLGTHCIGCPSSLNSTFSCHFFLHKFLQIVICQRLSNAIFFRTLSDRVFIYTNLRSENAS